MPPFNVMRACMMHRDSRTSNTISWYSPNFPRSGENPKQCKVSIVLCNNDWNEKYDMFIVAGDCTLPDAMPERGPVHVIKQWHWMLPGCFCMLPETYSLATLFIGQFTLTADVDRCARTVSIVDVILRVRLKIIIILSLIKQIDRTQPYNGEKIKNN